MLYLRRTANGTHRIKAVDHVHILHLTHLGSSSCPSSPATQTGHIVQAAGHVHILHLPPLHLRHYNYKEPPAINMGMDIDIHTTPLCVVLSVLRKAVWFRYEYPAR